MSERDLTRRERRRGQTRWLLLVPSFGLVAVAIGIVALELAAPEAEIVDLRVEDIPAPSMDDERSCTRRTDDVAAEEIRGNFLGGGRITSTQVYLCPSAFDGLTVTYVGEVIGEVLERRGGAWAQVNDDAYALEFGPLIAHRERAGFNAGMSVWLPDGLHEGIEDVGRFQRRGDVILVRGTLHQSDPNDGGGITIRAEEMTVIAPTTEVEDPLHVPQLIVATVLALLAAGTVIWSRSTTRRG